LPIGMIAWIDAPRMPDGPVGFERALRIRRIRRQPIAHVALDLRDRTQSPLDARPKGLLPYEGTGRHRIDPQTPSTCPNPRPCGVIPRTLMIANGQQ
jgi:hypothetical protein